MHAFYIRRTASLTHPPSAAVQGTHAAWIRAHGIVRTDRELHKLFTTMALRYRDRPGGYTRLIPTGFRAADAAPMAVIE